MGRGTFSIVAAGTGEALPGPAVCDAVGAWGPITGDPGKGVPGRVGVGGGRSTDAVLLVVTRGTAEPVDSTTIGVGRAAASSMRVGVMEVAR